MLFFFYDMIHETSISPTLSPPSPCYGLFTFGWRILVLLTIWVHHLSPFSLWAGVSFGTRQTDYYICSHPFSFLHLHQLIHDRSKSKNKSNKEEKKAKRASITDWIATFVLWSILSFSLFFFCQHFYPSSPWKLAKNWWSLYNGRTEATIMWPTFVPHFFFSHHWSTLLTLWHTLYFPQFSFFGSPFKEWLLRKSFYYHFYNPFPVEMGRRKIIIIFVRRYT